MVAPELASQSIQLEGAADTNLNDDSIPQTMNV